VAQDFFLICLGSSTIGFPGTTAVALRLSATLVKNYFQYRCERQIRYAMLTDEERLSLAIADTAEPESPWARAGLDFEKTVIETLSRTSPVLRPPPNQKQLDEVSTAAFLRLERPESFAHQPRLTLGDPAAFRRRWEIPPTIDLATAYPDLLRLRREKEKVFFQLIDLKAVQVPAPFHKAQVAFYSLMLEQVLREANLPYAVYPVGQIWHPDPERGPGEVRWIETAFRLAGYRAQVADFLRGALVRIGAAVVAPGRDETRFHLYFKCEQCDFLPHCEKAIGEDLPAAQRDVSAVQGLSHSSKQTLIDLGIRTVGQLATTAGLPAHPAVGWGLRSGADLLQSRAEALLDGQVRRLPGRLTHLMPPRVDAGIYLLFDQDPVEGRLAALGCLFRWKEREVFTPATVTAPGASAERDALLKVLTGVVAHLAAVDQHNAAHAQADPCVAHLFVYEPAEARDLHAVLGRHLGDANVRRGLLELVRMLPPEPLQPDPEYRGHRHLPATALRSVFDALYALPVQVSHDLRRVSAAFARATPPLAVPYRPGPDFQRPFSARLNIDRCRDLKTGRVEPRAVERDVRERLTTLAGLVDWVLGDNARSEVPFLRLNKEPFRFQTSFNPLASDDLGLLEAQELLANRAGELATLTALALPLAQRRQRFRCLAPLRLVEQGESPRFQGGRRLRFLGPHDGRYSELGPHSFGVVLTDGDPDLLLNPDVWGELTVSVHEVRAQDDRASVTVDVHSLVWGQGTLQRLLQERAADGWSLDQVFLDENTKRLQKFLRHLAGEGGSG
jgi:hypothetical protein